MVDVRNVIEKIVKDEFNIDIGKVNPDSELRDQVDLDSMRFVEIYAALIDELGVEIPSKIMESRTLNQIVSIIEEALRQTGSR
ncbi:hypothetical protein CHISP_0480 [Chitinispirillum alkaliphilum]|nr:hypothetical protein CHISP_0480 [Chitinispirillum alkaliphilum]